MAVAVTNVLASGSGTGANSYTSASNSDTGDRYYLLTVTSRANISADPNVPTVTGKGLTWVNVASVGFDSSNPSRKRTSLFRAYGSASSGALTFDFSGQSQTHCVWVLDEVTGMDTGGTNGSAAIVQSATNVQQDGGATTTLSVTLSTFGSANNATYGTFSEDDPSQPGATAGSGFTLKGTSGTFSVAAVTEFRADNDASVDITWTNSATNHGGIAVELKAAAGGRPTVFDLDAATFSYSAKVSQNAQTAVLNTKAWASFSAKAVQNKLTATTTAATFSWSAKTVQNRLTATLTAAQIRLTGLAISARLAVSLTTATMASWSAKALQNRLIVELTRATLNLQPLAMDFVSAAIVDIVRRFRSRYSHYRKLLKQRRF